MKILFIDATNLRSGGALTHITELLNHAKNEDLPFDKVYIAGGKRVFLRLQDRSWLKKVSHKWLNNSLAFILLWRFLFLKRALKEARATVLFAPAGTYIGRFRPYAVMSRNMLIFDSEESARFGMSFMRLKFLLLRLVQRISFEKSQQIIFISNYARKTILPLLSLTGNNIATIYHGINAQFNDYPREQKPISSYSFDNPFVLLYVSPVTVYKHQENVVKAVSKLFEDGYPIILHLVGGAYKPSLKKLKNTFLETGADGKFVKYFGSASSEEIYKIYKNADGFIFASTCENMPNTLIEAMSGGLPIMCSKYPPMPEFLGESPYYFDPLSVEDICCKLRKFFSSAEDRYLAAVHSYKKAQEYNWEKCAQQTLSELSKLKS